MIRILKKSSQYKNHLQHVITMEKELLFYTLKSETESRPRTNRNSSHKSFKLLTNHLL